MFKLVAPYELKGEQITAIEELTNIFLNGLKEQILLGATLTGKTFTISNIIQKLGKKNLVFAHNKILVGLLYGEFKRLFLDNRVEYFIS